MSSTVIDNALSIYLANDGLNGIYF